MSARMRDSYPSGFVSGGRKPVTMPDGFADPVRHKTANMADVRKVRPTVAMNDFPALTAKCPQNLGQFPDFFLAHSVKAST